METLIALLRRWTRRRQTRLHLAELEPHLLADVGLDEAMQARECACWFWQPWPGLPPARELPNTPANRTLADISGHLSR